MINLIDFNAVYGWQILKVMKLSEVCNPLPSQGVIKLNQFLNERTGELETKLSLRLDLEDGRITYLQMAKNFEGKDGDTLKDLKEREVLLLADRLNKAEQQRVLEDDAYLIQCMNEGRVIFRVK